MTNEISQSVDKGKERAGVTVWKQFAAATLL